MHDIRSNSRSEGGGKNRKSEGGEGGITDAHRPSPVQMLSMGVVGGRERDKFVDTKVRSKFIDSKLKYTSNIVRCTAWISGVLFLLVFKEKGRQQIV